MNELFEDFLINSKNMEKTFEPSSSKRKWRCLFILLWIH